MKIKRTEWVCVVATGNKYDKTQRVYEDEYGNLYIRKKSGYLLINNLPCGKHIFRG